MKLRSFFLPLPLLSFLFPSSALAQWCHGDPDSGVETALGCINTFRPNLFVGQILTWSVGLAGFAGIMAIVYAAILIITSSGDPKKVKAGQELILSALTGIALIVLSIVLLNFIGVQVLNLGGVGFRP